MSNPLRILRTLDQNLTLPAELTLFGRAALALGYPRAPDHFHNTQDVDGILPLAWLQPPDAHQDFWQAVERTNVELEGQRQVLPRRSFPSPKKNFWHVQYRRGRGLNSEFGIKRQRSRYSSL